MLSTTMNDAKVLFLFCLRDLRPGSSVGKSREWRSEEFAIRGSCWQGRVLLARLAAIGGIFCPFEFCFGKFTIANISSYRLEFNNATGIIEYRSVNPLRPMHLGANNHPIFNCDNRIFLAQGINESGYIFAVFFKHDRFVVMPNELLPCEFKKSTEAFINKGHGSIWQISGNQFCLVFQNTKVACLALPQSLLCNSLRSR
jgi:hypothetical protein